MVYMYRNQISNPDLWVPPPMFFLEHLVYRVTELPYDHDEIGAFYHFFPKAHQFRQSFTGKGVFAEV